VRGAAERLALDVRLAELNADHLGDPLAAIDHCRDVVERVGPGDVQALERPVAILERYYAEPLLQKDAAPVLEVAYRKLGRHAELAGMLEVKCRAASEAELPGILDEMIMLVGGVQEAPEKAFRILLRRFAVTPSDPEVWVELEHAASPLNAWEELAAAWSEMLARDPPAPLLASDARPGLRLRLADVYHRRLIELGEDRRASAPCPRPPTIRR
jgi:hypothetical protein